MMNKEQEIKDLMEKLNLTKEEAEELWAFDNDEIENEEVAQIEQATIEEQEEEEKKAAVKKVVVAQRRAKSAENKEIIINDVFDSTIASENTKHCQQMTNTKMSFVDEDGFFYTVQVTMHKKRPEGYDMDLRAAARED